MKGVMALVSFSIGKPLIIVPVNRAAPYGGVINPTIRLNPNSTPK
jgi:hypothetical protein